VRPNGERAIDLSEARAIESPLRPMTAKPERAFVTPVTAEKRLPRSSPRAASRR
jgi:hypothetical protein